MTRFLASITVRNVVATTRRLRGATLVAAGLLAAGCATTLVSEPVERRGDGWTITLRELTDGPNEVSVFGGAYRPELGMRFLHATLTFRNDSPKRRQFGYEACDLDLEQERVLPHIFSPPLGMNSETFAPGQSSSRTLTFSYPEGRFPTRIKCAYVTFELVQMPANKRPGA
jgi:hypothetical protein